VAQQATAESQEKLLVQVTQVSIMVQAVAEQLAQQAAQAQQVLCILGSKYEHLFRTGH
jgi:hypothetical protein